MAQIESDLGTHLEWVAIDHHDRAHPHFHIVVRGVDEEGNALLLARDYVRAGIRARSQGLRTRTNVGPRRAGLTRSQRLAPSGWSRAANWLFWTTAPIGSPLPLLANLETRPRHGPC